MIYLHSYCINSSNGYMHDFYNPDDSCFYTTAVYSNKYNNYHQIILNDKEDKVFRYNSINIFTYELPKKLNIIRYIDSKYRCEQLLNSKFRIALNSI